MCGKTKDTAIKPLNANFIFTVSKFINIYYILTVYNTFCREMDPSAGSGCCVERHHVGKNGKKYEEATESKAPSPGKGDNSIVQPDKVSGHGDRSSRLLESWS